MKLIQNKQKCLVNGKLGMVIRRYTYTADVLIFSTRKTMFGVHHRYIHLLPIEKPQKNPSQLKLFE